MFRASNPVKRRQWAQRLERYRQSGQTVARFCEAEQVRVPTFYPWRRKLLGSPNSKALRPGRTARAHGGLLRRRPASSNFRSLRVVATTPNSPAATIRLPRGIVMELGSDPLLIEKIVDQLLNHASSAGSGTPC
jgi:hypothetical protein